MKRALQITLMILGTLVGLMTVRLGYLYFKSKGTSRHAEGEFVQPRFNWAAPHDSIKAEARALLRTFPFDKKPWDESTNEEVLRRGYAFLLKYVYQVEAAAIVLSRASAYQQPDYSFRTAGYTDLVVQTIRMIAGEAEQFEPPRHTGPDSIVLHDITSAFTGSLSARVFYADTSGPGRSRVSFWDAGTARHHELMELPTYRLDQLEISYSGSLAFVAANDSGREVLHYWRNGREYVLDAPGHDAHLWGTGGDMTHPKVSRDFPAFMLSPSGMELIAWWRRALAVVDTGGMTEVWDLTFSHLGPLDSTFATAAPDTFISTGLGADNDWYWRVLAWDVGSPQSVLLGKHFPGQLSSRNEGLWRYQFGSTTWQAISSEFADYLDLSPDGTSLLFQNDDETCCTGTNYTDNEVTMFSLASGAMRQLYDEYASYGNYEKAEEHTPGTSRISPDNRRVAITIHDYKDWVRKSSTPEELPPGVRDSVTVGVHVRLISTTGEMNWEIPDCMVEGWTDADHLLVRESFRVYLPASNPMESGDWEERLGRYRLLNIHDRTSTYPIADRARVLGIRLPPLNLP